MKQQLIKSYEKYQKRVEYIQEHIQTSDIGSLQLQEEIYKIYTSVLKIFEEFYQDSQQISINVMQHYCRFARKRNPQLDLTVKQLSSIRHFSIIVPNGITEQELIDLTIENSVTLLNNAVQFPQDLPKKSSITVPIFDLGTCIYKKPKELTLITKPFKVIKQFSNFRDKIVQQMQELTISNTTKSYMRFSHQFTKELHKANKNISSDVINDMKNKINQQFEDSNETDSVGNIVRLPPQDLIESIQIISLTIFHNRHPEHSVGRDLFTLIDDLHFAVSKKGQQSVSINREYIEFLFDVIVILLKTEYSYKYNISFWDNYQYTQINEQDIYYLLRHELKRFQKDWQTPISEYKQIILQLYNQTIPQLIL